MQPSPAPRQSANQFAKFQIHPRLIDNLNQLGFVSPTPIQAEAIPLVMSGKDIFGQASTGTGKTGAFLIPIIHKLATDRDARALVLAPTRELAQQILNVATSMAKDGPVKCLAIVGGESMFRQIQVLQRRPQLLIATPGRLIDHMSSGKLKLPSLSFLVLDEVDRMLDMGFAPQLEEISEYLPKERQNLCFSATMTPSVRRIMNQYTQNTIDVIVKKSNDEPLKIEEQDVIAAPREKNQVLINLVREKDGKIIVFASTQVRTEQVAGILESEGHEVTLIHGGLSQRVRRSALADFRSGKARIMVATDVASRGIDVNDIEHVVNFDLPQSKDDYTHRIGRTGRYGKSGFAYNFVSPGFKSRDRWEPRRTGGGNGGQRRFGGGGAPKRFGGGRSPERGFADRGPRRRDFDRPQTSSRFADRPSRERSYDENGESKRSAPRRPEGGAPRTQRNSTGYEAPRAPKRSEGFDGPRAPRRSSGYDAPRAPRKSEGFDRPRTPRRTETFGDSPRSPRRPEGRSEARNERPFQKPERRSFKRPRREFDRDND
jgi:ATP-dependent RNA helicase DeaD